MKPLKVTYGGKEYFYEKKQILVDKDVYDHLKKQQTENGKHRSYSAYLRQVLGL